MSTSARRIRITHPNLLKSQKTYLDADYTSGTALTVLSNEAFAANQIAVAGEPGTEKTESQTIASIATKATINITSAFNFSHNKGEIIYRSEYDQVEVSYFDSSWTVLSTLGIQWDQLKTIYVHDGGTDSFSYRFRFKNSLSGNFSEYSPTIAGSGYTKYSVGRMVENVRKIIRDPDKKIITDSEIIRYLNAAKDIIKAKRSNWWFWQKEDEGTITTVAATLTYNLDDISSNLEYIRGIRYNYDDGAVDEIYPLNNRTEIEIDDLVRDNDRTGDDRVTDYNIKPGDTSSTAGYIRVFPTPVTTGYGSFYVRFYQPDDDYNSVSDTTSIPVPRVLEDYAISQGLRIKGNDEKADIFEELFWGPSARGKKIADKMGGVALLERMQNDKGRETGKARQMKIYRGRNFGRVYSNRIASNRDQRKERYW